MDVVYLARHPMPPVQWALSLMVLGLLTAPLIIFLLAWVRVSRAAQFKGLALTGTAQLLSAAQADELAPFGAAWIVEMMHGRSERRHPCRIGLRVQIPGRPPYDVSVTTPVGNTWLYQVQPGWTYAVQVDSTDPENVRFDYRYPMGTPPGWYPDPSGAQAQRYWDGRQWTASVQPRQH